MNVLNRYGHITSNTATEEIETELKCEATKENFLIPNDMKPCKIPVLDRPLITMMVKWKKHPPWYFTYCLPTEK